MKLKTSSSSFSSILIIIIFFISPLLLKAQDNPCEVGRFFIPTFKASRGTMEIKEYMIDNISTIITDKIVRESIKSENIGVLLMDVNTPVEYHALKLDKIYCEEYGICEESFKAPRKANILLIGLIHYFDQTRKVQIELNVYSFELRDIIGFGKSSQLEMQKFFDEEDREKLAEEAYNDCFKKGKLKKFLKQLPDPCGGLIPPVKGGVENDSQKLKVGASSWYNKLKFQEPAEPPREYNGLLLGPIVDYSILKLVNLNIQTLFGKLERTDNQASRKIKNIDGLVSYRKLLPRVEVIDYVFIGGGWRYWVEDIKTNNNNDRKNTTGPILSTGIRFRFSNCRFGSDSSLNWLPTEVNAGDKNDAHTDIDIGLDYLFGKRLYIEAGWRHRTFYEREDNRTISGIMLSLLYHFN